MSAAEIDAGGDTTQGTEMQLSAHFRLRSRCPDAEDRSWNHWPNDSIPRFEA